MQPTNGLLVSYPVALLALLCLLPGVQPAQAQTKITIAHIGPLAGSWAHLVPIAQEQGLFAKYGLDATVRIGPIGLVGTEAQIGLYGSPAVLQRGTDLKILGAVDTGRITGRLITSPKIKRPEDLRGKRFGTAAMGAGNWISIIRVLQHFGLEPERDNISIISVGNMPQIAKALEDGAIDAAMLTPAVSSQMVSKGFFALLDPYQIDIFGAQGVLTTTGTYLQEHPEAVEKAVTAIVDAMAFSVAPANKHTVLNTIMNVFNLTDIATAKAGYETLGDLNRKPYPSVEKLKNLQRIMALHNSQVLKLNPEDLVHDRVVRTLDESGVIDRLYSFYAAK